MKPSKKLIELTIVVLQKQAVVDFIRPKIEAIHAKILEEVKPITADEYDLQPNKITSWDDMYMAEEESYVLCSERKIAILREQGYIITGKEYEVLAFCPLLKATVDQQKAEKKMMYQAMADLGLQFDR